MEKSGKKIVRLEVGEPSFSTPDSVVGEAIKALKEGLTHYTHSKGIQELRSLLCKKYNLEFKTNLNPNENILITPGGKQAIFYIISSLVDKGDEVIIFTPAWVSYEDVARMAGGIPIFVECKKENNFDISFEDFKSKITKKTKAVIINSPNNPTGRIIKKEILKKIIDVCIKKDILLISDEIYDKIIFDKNKHYSILSINPKLKNCVLVNGFSKTYAMTGWRVGYVLAEKRFIDAMLKIQQNTVSCLSDFIQRGALAAIEKSNKFVKKSLGYYQQNKDILKRAFERGGNFKMIEPEGGLYAFIDVSSINRNSSKFCSTLLEKTGISAVPGIVFGKSGEGYIRICLAVETEKIIEFVRKIKL